MKIFHQVPHTGNSTSNDESKSIIILIFIIYILLRIFAWTNVTVLEDFDSLREISLTKMWLSKNFLNILKDSPDNTYVYSFLSAIFSLPGWSPQFGTRLCTFFFTIILFFIIAAISKRISTPEATLYGLFLLCIDPYLIKISFSVLTEPLYIVTVYLGLYVLWTSLKNLKLSKALFIGLIFGSAFANRTEGITFIVFVPLIVSVYAYFNRFNGIDFKKSFTWILIFSLGFAIIAIPQIWLVSSKMGKFSFKW